VTWAFARNAAGTPLLQAQANGSFKALDLTIKAATQIGCLIKDQFAGREVLPAPLATER
jgi:hypothetical protein